MCYRNSHCHIIVSNYIYNFKEIKNLQVQRDIVA